MPQPRTQQQQQQRLLATVAAVVAVVVPTVVAVFGNLKLAVSRSYLIARTEYIMDMMIESTGYTPQRISALVKRKSLVSERR